MAKSRLHRLKIPGNPLPECPLQPRQSTPEPLTRCGNLHVSVLCFQPAERVPRTATSSSGGVAVVSIVRDDTCTKNSSPKPLSEFAFTSAIRRRCQPRSAGSRLTRCPEELFGGLTSPGFRHLVGESILTKAYNNINLKSLYYYKLASNIRNFMLHHYNCQLSNWHFLSRGISQTKHN